jgi:DNA-directed RNA polymerase sigma subunit (sigma70/sigma32)
MTDTCALDIADRGGITLEEVGEIMNLTRERVRQVETAGLAKLAALDEITRLKDYVL